MACHARTKYTLVRTAPVVSFARPARWLTWEKTTKRVFAASSAEVSIIHHSSSSWSSSSSQPNCLRQQITIWFWKESSMQSLRILWHRGNGDWISRVCVDTWNFIFIIRVYIDADLTQVVYFTLSCHPSCAFGKVVELGKLLVSKELRRLGHGQRALSYAVQKMFDNGAASMSIFSPNPHGSFHFVVYVDLNNTFAAGPFYRQFGFKLDAVGNLALSISDFVILGLIRARASTTTTTTPLSLEEKDSPIHGSSWPLCLSI